MYYPRLTALLLSILLGIIFYTWEQASFGAHGFFQTYLYPMSFIAGVFIVYGLTAAPATALLLFLGHEPGNLWLCWLLATLGAILGDYLIFRFVRFSLAEELHRLRGWRLWLYLPRWHERLPARLRQTLRIVLAGFLIASPLPDEFGIALLATSRRISTPMFLVTATILDAVGIAVILWLGDRFLT